MCACSEYFCLHIISGVNDSTVEYDSSSSTFPFPTAHIFVQLEALVVVSLGDTSALVHASLASLQQLFQLMFPWQELSAVLV